MSFRASSIIPVNGLAQAKNRALSYRNTLTNYTSAMSTGASSNEVLDAMSALVVFKAELSAFAAIPGINEYASAQEDDASYDISAEFVALQATIDTAIATIKTTFPADGSGFLLSHTFAPDGTVVARSFTVPQLANVVSDINAVIASIS